MRHLLVSLVLTGLCCTGKTVLGQMVVEMDFEKRANAMVGKPFPAFEVRNGGTLSISSKDLQGKIVFVNFWFAGCEPCMKEMPALNKLYDTLKTDKQFLFLSISFDDEEVAGKVVKLFDIKYPITRVSEQESHRLNGMSGYPTSYLLDKRGIIRWVKLGGIEKEIASGALIQSVYPGILSQP